MKPHLDGSWEERAKTYRQSDEYAHVEQARTYDREAYEQKADAERRRRTKDLLRRAESLFGKAKGIHDPPIRPPPHRQEWQRPSPQPGPFTLKCHAWTGLNYLLITLLCDPSQTDLVRELLQRGEARQTKNKDDKENRH